MSTDQPVDSKTLEQTKQQIRELVSEIAQLKNQDLDAEQYYAELLQRVVNALAAVGGAVWTLNDGGRLELGYPDPRRILYLRCAELAFGQSRASDWRGD